MCSNHWHLDCWLDQPFVQAQIKENISSTSLAFVRGIHRWPVDSPHKGPLTRELFPFNYFIIISSIPGVDAPPPCVARPSTAIVSALGDGWVLDPQQKDIKSVVFQCEGMIWNINTRLCFLANYTKHVSQRVSPVSCIVVVNTLTWQPFCSRHFPSKFHEWKLLYFALIFIEIVLECPINYMPTLVHIMTWHRVDYKPLSDPISTQICVAIWHH